MNDTNQICHLVPVNSTKYFKIPVYAVVLVAGLPLNCLALWASVYQMKRSVILSVYITNLMLANLLQILMLPFEMYCSYWNHQWGLGKAALVVATLAFRTNFHVKNNFLCLIAMERYLGLVHPLWFRGLQTMRGATMVSIVTWLLVATLCAIGVGLQVEPWQPHCLDGSRLNDSYALFKLSIMLLSFVIPCLLMGFFYFRVLVKLRKVVSLERREKRQIYRFISLIITTFFLLFTPFQVTSHYRYYWEVKRGDDIRICDLVTDTYIYTHATLCLAILANIFDPLLYILLLKGVRMELRGAFSSRVHQTGISYDSEPQDRPPSFAIDQMQNQPGTQGENR